MHMINDRPVVAGDHPSVDNSRDYVSIPLDCRQ